MIIPVYNGEKYIVRAINSILIQPCADKIEIIVINDGSTDRTFEICELLSSNNSNVHFFTKENEGVAIARNDGLDRAKGQYIAFLDADDWWTYDFFDTDIADLCEKDDYDLLRFSYNLISSDCRYKISYETSEDSWSPFWTYLFSRKMIDNTQLRFFPVKYNEDGSFLQRCSFLSKSIYHNNKPMVNWYMNNASAMHKSDRLLLFDEHCKSLEYLRDWFKQSGNRETNIEPQMLSMVAQTIEYLCANKSYGKVKDIFCNDERFHLIYSYSEYPVDDELSGLLNLWKKKPFYFWITKGRAYRIKWEAKRLIKRCPQLSRVLMWGYYSLRNGEKILPDEKEYISRISGFSKDN